MATYVVMVPEPQRPREPVFIRDSFAFLAFLLPFVWLLWHRLWIEAALAFGAVLLIGGIGEQAGFGPYASLLSLLVSIYVGLEGPAMRIAALRRRGWLPAGVVEADSVADAEIRYFASGAHPEPEASLQSLPTPEPGRQPSTTPAASGPALGLLDYPGAR